MAEPDIYDSLPDDPEEAFVYLAIAFKTECEREVYNANENENIHRYYVEYISKILAAVRALDLESEFSSRSIPSIADVSYNAYLDFSKDVEHYVTSLRIRRVRKQRGLATSFDTATKTKLHHYLSEIRDVVTHLTDILPDKKEALFDRISDLQKEIDRDRTGMERFGSIAMAVSGIVGESVEKTRILDLLDKIGGVLWGKQPERRQLPPPPKQIEHKKPSYVSDLDDDIPF